jgi:hypothetical protein
MTTEVIKYLQWFRANTQLPEYEIHLINKVYEKQTGEKVPEIFKVKNYV